MGEIDNNDYPDFIRMVDHISDISSDFLAGIRFDYMRIS